MNIDKMPAGREMDALIASRIFGLTIMKDSLDGEVRAWRPTERSNPPNFFEGVQVPFLHYSTDIAAAWKVVEALRQGWQGHAAACIDIRISDWVKFPDCKVTIFGPDIAKVKAEADSAPLAICRAVLKAMDRESQ